MARPSTGAVTWMISSDSGLKLDLYPGNGPFLNQRPRIAGERLVVLLNHGSTAHRPENFGSSDLPASLRSEYLPAEEDGISGEAKHRESCKEISSSAKEGLYKLQCRFRIEPEISHDWPLTQAACL
jgi:hypothetical protein